MRDTMCIQLTKDAKSLATFTSFRQAQRVLTYRPPLLLPQEGQLPDDLGDSSVQVALQLRLGPLGTHAGQ